MLSTRRSVTVLAVVLLAASAGAQLAHEATILWGDTLGPPGQLNRTVASEASGDGRLDLFVRGGTNNSQIVFFDGIWTGSGGLNTGIACNDFDAAPGQGPSGIGALAYVSASGLRLLKRNSITSTSFEFLPPTTLSGEGWINAKIVRTGDIDGTGSLDYVGVKEDGRTLILRLNGGPTNAEVDTGRTILDVVLVDWGPAGAKEIAVLSTQGVEIRSASLVAVDAISPTPGYASKAIAALVTPGPTDDRLAWIGTRNATGKTWFATLKRLATRVENQYQLDDTDTTASALATGDVDADGDTDVVITRTSSPSPWLLSSAAQSSSIWFDLDNDPEVKSIVTFPTTLTSTGTPVMARFYNDVTTELVIPAYSGSNAEIGLFLKPNYNPRLTSGDVFQFQHDGQAPNSEQLFLGSTGQERELRFQLNFQDETLNTQGGTADLRLEVMMWTGAAGEHVSNLIDERYWISWPANIAQNLIVQGTWVTLPVDTTDNCAMAPRFIEVRQIRVGTNYAVIESGPTYTFGLARGPIDYHQYWPTPWAHEFADLDTTAGAVNTTFFCQASQEENPVYARAIVIRRKPSPVSSQGVPLPVPNQTSGSTTPGS